MLIETVISTIKDSSNQAKKLIRKNFKKQDFYLKKLFIIIGNFNLTKNLQKIRTCLDNSENFKVSIYPI